MDDLGLLLDQLRHRPVWQVIAGLPDGNVWRVARFLAVVDATRACLGEASARIDSPVLVSSSDPLRTVAAVCACLWQGYCVAVVDARLPPAVVLEIAGLLKPRVVLLSDEHAPLHAWPPGIDPRMIPRGSLVGSSMRAISGVALTPPVDCDAEGDAFVFLTSGSSGVPKGVRLSRRAVAAHLRTLWTVWGGGVPIRMGSILPLHHADGMIQGALLPILFGGLAWLTPGGGWDRLSPLGEAVHRHALTHALLTPTHVTHFLWRAGAQSDALRGPAFRFAIATAAPLADEVWEGFQRVFGVPLANVYGLTETVAGSCFAVPGTDSHHVGTVGKPVDCEVRVVDDKGMSMAPGTIGELQIRGRHLYSGYVGADDHARIAEGGWLHTGDAGSVDTSGYVRVHGRLTSSFKSGAVLVNPEATTAVLRREPQVLDAASIDVTDATLGSLLATAVVLRPGSTLRASDLIARLRQLLPGHQMPRQLILVDELPLGSSGKVQDDRLRELFGTRLHRGTQPGQTAWTVARGIAADAFGVAADNLSQQDTPSSVAGWDSFGHITFVSGLESWLGRVLTLEEIQGLRSLADAVLLLEDAGS